MENYCSPLLYISPTFMLLPHYLDHCSFIISLNIRSYVSQFSSSLSYVLKSAGLLQNKKPTGISTEKILNIQINLGRTNKIILSLPIHERGISTHLLSLNEFFSATFSRFQCSGLIFMHLC